MPPEIAEYVFARSVAKKVHHTTRFKVESEPLIPVRMYQDTRSFTAPRYKPREYWQWTLETTDFEAGTWQSDLVRYWRLRRNGRSEEDAWEEVAMSPEHARLALTTEVETMSNDSGLIPCYQDGAYIETVAQRVLARAASMEVDCEDIYEKLKLEPTVVVRRESGPEHAAPHS